MEHVIGIITIITQFIQNDLIRRKVKQRLKKGEYLNENEEEEDFINKHGDYYIKFNKTYYDSLNEEDKDKYLRYFSNK